MEEEVEKREGVVEGNCSSDPFETEEFQIEKVVDEGHEHVF